MLVTVTSASVNVGCMCLFELEFCVNVCPGVGLLNLNSFPGGSAGKESACNTGDLGLIPGLGRSPGEGKGCPLQDSGLENSVDWGHGVSGSHFHGSSISSFLRNSHTVLHTDYTSLPSHKWWF